MLSRDLQTSTSDLHPGGGDSPPGPSQRGLEPSVRRAASAEINKGAVRGEQESRVPSWGRQLEDHKGAEENHGVRGSWGDEGAEKKH